MATIAYDTLEAPGKGRRSPAFSKGGRMDFLTGTLTFDSGYTTGGEDLSEIFDHFNNTSGTTTLKGILFEGTNVATKRVAVDYSAEKAKIFVEDGTSGIEAEAANASDQSAVVVRFLAWGLR